MKNLQTLSLSGNILSMADYSNPSSNYQASYVNSNNSSSMSPKKTKKFFKNNKYLPFIVVIAFVSLIAVFAVRNVMTSNNSSSQSLLATDKRVDVDKPTAQQVLNKSFSYPLRDATGKEVSKLKYEIQNAELRDEIIVKGQRATSVKGRTFLILNLKITNSYDKSIQLNSKDYVRLVVGSSPENLAADIHNDPVDVQAISTKYTRLGFPINDDEKSLTLQVGEISGKKETITLDLK
jgi:hypothetical protein